MILSTGQFFGESVDIREILAFPFSFEGKLAQYIGRLRDIGDQRLIIDYRDKTSTSLRGNGITRSWLPR